MHFKGFDLNLLVVLDALLEEESVSKAALRLNVSQPAVSAALAKLRWHTGDELLEKIGRTVRLTPRAQEMIKPVKDVLREVELVLKGPSEFDPQILDRDFSISMTSFSSQVVLPSLIERLQHEAPRVKCSVEDIAFDAVTRIKTGELDFCVTVLQTRLLNPRENLDQLSHEHLFTDRWVMVGCASNPRLNGPISFEQFCSIPYVEVRPGGLPSLVERTLDEIPNRPRAAVSVPSFSLAIRNVIDTNYVTVVPMLTVESQSLPMLKVLEPPFHVPEIDQFLVWHSRNDLEPGHRFFRELLLDSTRTLRDGPRPEIEGMMRHSVPTPAGALSHVPGKTH